jgi:NAD(P)-dependent dehydrogenase (short-subunit alcohol dehydrogenase family)
MTFNGRTVFVTGAAGNLGRAVATAFFQRGANLVLAARKRGQLEDAYARDARRLFVCVDLLDSAQVEAATQAAVERYGRIDIVCNVAGAFQMGSPVHETSDELWQAMLDLNARTIINIARAVVPRMITAGSGKIVNVAAAAALSGKANMGAYCVAKSAVVRLTESMAAELRGKGINVNCVMPSIIDTQENRAVMPDSDPRLWVAPDALAEVIVFLGSEAARAIHGASIPVVGLS